MWAADGVATILGMLPGDASAYAAAAAHDGAVIVGTSQDNAQIARAFRWTRAAGMELLGAAPSGVMGTVAASISGDGSIVAGGGPTSDGEAALIWDASHGWRLLASALATDYRIDIPGWTLTRATAIADDGHTVAGYGTNPLGQTEAWIVQLPR
jgi:uncharacterized membrane protein